MKYEEALKAKEELGEITTIDGFDHYIYIGPYDEVEYQLWLNDYKENNTLIPHTDQRAKGYYQNPESAEFKIYGIFIDGFFESIKELKS